MVPMGLGEACYYELLRFLSVYGKVGNGELSRVFGLCRHNGNAVYQCRREAQLRSQVESLNRFPQVTTVICSYSVLLVQEA